jgi:tRNA G18 (ribose-2'-O)-methylase SpoU
MRKLSPTDIDRLSRSDATDATPHPISVIIHNVRSIYNVGSMFRTSDAARVEHLYLTGYTGTPEHEKLHKTALGAQDVVPWSKHEEALPVIHDLRAKGYTIGVLEITDAPVHPAEVAPDAFPLAMVVGNEVRGVDDQIVAAADLALELPQYGMKQSLNVSVAYGMAVSHLVRRFRRLHDLPDAPGESALHASLPNE